jgi:exopolyphosphatase/guanosine-5'-triphosphate,3'-diphosphate pyrophosphatase
MSPIARRDSNYSTSKASPEMVAVIDIGSSSVRMQIAEIQYRTGEIRNLESFAQAVSVGRDSFMMGSIGKATIEDCVRVLQVYRHKLDEYGVTDPRQIRVIATSAVREASNRMAFSDRVFVATGFEIEPFEEAELHRVTYLGILPFMQGQPEYFQKKSLICEVGGGTSELLLLDGADVKFSKTYRLGSLRLRKLAEKYDIAQSKSRALMESQVLQALEAFRAETNNVRPQNIIAMGGDIRFAANEINQKPVGDELVEIKMKDLGEFVDEIIRQPPDSLAARYHMSLPDARSLGPGLLIQWMIAKHLNVDKFLVAKVNLRDGLIKEMSQERVWSESIQKQIVQSAIRLGRKYGFNEAHAKHVAKLACSLFDQLESIHFLPSRFRGILELAALLHEIGEYINSKSKHKHSAYLIRNSDFFGIGERDLGLVALVARYHRGAMPQPRHDGYFALDRYLRVAVSKLAAILRISKALDVRHLQKLKKVGCELRPNRLNLKSESSVDLSLEQLELKQVAELFERIFGRHVSLESATKN